MKVIDSIVPYRADGLAGRDLIKALGIQVDLAGGRARVGRLNLRLLSPRPLGEGRCLGVAELEGPALRLAQDGLQLAAEEGKFPPPSPLSPPPASHGGEGPPPRPAQPTSCRPGLQPRRNRPPRAAPASHRADPRRSGPRVGKDEEAGRA
jgi:hypothetical protein